MIRRLLAVLGLAAGLALHFAAPAGALNLPGSDCLNPPVPSSPMSGVSSWIDPGPAHPVTGDPFSTAPNHPSIYDVYGYAGTSVVPYDPPTIGPTCVSVDPSVTVIHGMMGASSVVVATAVRLYRTILSPTFGGIFDPIQHAAQNIIGNGLFLPLISVTITAAGAWVLWRAHKDNVAHTANRTGKLILIAGAGVACIVYPLTIGAAVDKAIGDTISTVATMAVSADPRHEPADALAGAAQTAVNYNTWAQQTFGTGPEGDAAAKEFGPRLFEAGAWTRTEAAAIAADPSKAQPWIDAKQQRYKDTAAAVKAKYPGAYEYLRGAQTDSQFGFGLVGVFGALLAVGFLIYALFKVGYSLILVRVGIGAAPAVALVAAFPTQQHRAAALFQTLGKALVTAVVLGAGAIVFTVAGVGGILSPTTQLPPFLKLLAMGLLTYTLWRGAKQFGVISEKLRLKQEERNRRYRRFDVPRRPDMDMPEPESSYVFTAESRMRPRRAPRPVVVRTALAASRGGGPAAIGAAATPKALRPAPPKARQIAMSPNYLPSRPATASKGVYTIHSLGGSK